MAAPKKQRGLGKGLDALFGDAEVTLRAKTDKKEEENQVKAEEAEAKVEDKEVSSGGIAYIDINDIKPNSTQPRKIFDEEKLQELASSIEEAEGISQMMETYGLTQEQVSKSLGKSRPYIANSLRLLKIADKVKQYVINGDLSSGHARALAAIADEARQIAIADIAVKQGLSVREIEKLAKQNKDAAKPKPRVKSKNADVIRVEEDLKEVLGTKVNLNQKGKKGKIEIEFYSREDLERLIELLKTLS